MGGIARIWIWSSIATMLAGVAAAREYVVHGVDDPRPDLLARSLANDDGLLLLTSPLTTRKAYLAAVVDKTVLALEHAGYPEPRAAARLEASDDGERVVVDVTPGPRFTAAGIEITGLPDELAGDLRSWLKSQRPPADAMPQAVDADDGWSGTRWVDQRGQPARLEPPLWSRGQPAPFDAHHVRDLRAAIARFLRDHGHFAAARAVEKPVGTGPRCEVTVGRDAGEATLTVAFTDLPRPAVLDEIEVAPASRTTAATLRELLGIGIGTTVTEHDRLAWQEALRATGRFVRHDVKFKERKAGPDGATGIVAIFDLDAYPPVPPLGTPLSSEEETLLRCRSWLLDTLANDDDLVATWTKAGAQRVTAAVTVSTREGVLVAALPGTADACGLAASGAGLGFFLPQGAGRFEFPLPVRTRAVIDVAFTLADEVTAGRHRYLGSVTAGAKLQPRPRDAAAAVAVTARIEPVACLALLHERGATTHWDGDVLVIEAAGTRMAIDGASGRLKWITGASGRIDVDAGPGRLALALAPLRDTAGTDAWRDDAPVSSAVGFLTSDSLGVALARLSEATGTQPLLAGWVPVFAAAARNIREAADRGGFARADEEVRAILVQVADDDTAALPAIPRAESATTASDPLMAVASSGASQAWRWLERSCGSTAWPCGLIRIAALAARRDSTGALWEITAYLAAPSHGPLANLVAAQVIPLPTMAVSFARQGQGRLSTAAFHADCEAVLSILGDCGLDRCAVSLIRSLDDDEARSAAAVLCHDPEALLPLVHDLKGCAGEDEAVAALPSALDRWWEASLRDLVAAALAAKTGTQTADNPDAEPTPRR
jgi:hypothetical protein